MSNLIYSFFLTIKCNFGNFMFKKLFLVLVLFIFFAGVGIVSASENITSDMDFENQLSVDGLSSEDITVNESQKSTNVESANVISYYKEKTELVACLKDSNDQPIQNKTLKFQIADKLYDGITDSGGKVTVTFTSLKPDTYHVKVYFDGDDEYASSQTEFTVKIKKAPLAIKMSNYNTYVDSDLFFKVKVYNTVTKNAVSGIKIKFKVYNPKTKKYSCFYRTTNSKGIASLNKNFKVGSYKISAKITDSKNKPYIYYKNSKAKVTMKVKPTAEWGCCSFYLQVSGTESIAGFRRDATNALTIYIKNVKFAGRTAIKQYKLGYGYFFHSITTSDGWMMGTGGIDNVAINKAIENLAGKMVSSNKISTSYLKKIQSYERRLGLGHFSIKAPDGRFAAVWLNGYVTGKLKPGEYISVPNLKSCYRHGTYEKFGDTPLKAAIKVGATDSFGVNRRDITVFHWKATTDKNFKTTSVVKTYAANDHGKFVGRSTGSLKDNIQYKNVYISKYDLPAVPGMKFIGTHKFGNIDKLIKKATIVSAPKISNAFNQTKYFKVTVKDKSNKKVLSGIKIKIKLMGSNFTKYFTVKTGVNGVAELDTKTLSNGTYNVVISPANNKYLISAKSTIVIK